MIINHNYSIKQFKLTFLVIDFDSSSANGINISDYDVEIVLVAPKMTVSSMDSAPSSESKDETNNNTSTTTPAGKKSASKLSLAEAEEDETATLTMKALAALLLKTGYKSIQQLDRYFDPSSEINVDYLSFIDPRSDLTCQITLDHPLGIRVRDLLQEYAHIDTRVEPLIFAVQQTLDNFGRCRQYLSNYSLALMTIAFLQTKKILPLLQRHLMQSSSPASSMQSTTHVANAKPSRALPSIASASTPSSRPQLSDKRQPSLPESEKANQPRNRQQEQSPATSKAQIKNQKRKDKKRIHREKTLPAATIQVKTMSGGIRMVDCRYDKALARTRPFDNMTTQETVAELLVDFMDYFGFSHGSTKCEISIISGSTTSPVGSTVSESGSQSAQDRVSKGTSPCLVVRDPFVTDRNVTWLCNQWRLSHCERMFMRALMFLEGVGVESDDEFDDDSSEDDDEFGLRGDNGSGGIGEDEIMEEFFAGYADDYDEEVEEDLSDNETYPIVPVDEMVDQLASMSLLALLASVSNQSHP